MQPADDTHLRAEYRRWLGELSAILFRLDPIGLNFEENTDEYDHEAGTILPRLRGCGSVADVDRVVHEELTRWFAPDLADRARNRAQLAEEIWSWWQRVS
jgi:hypothetical protein